MLTDILKKAKAKLTPPKPEQLGSVGEVEEILNNLEYSNISKGISIGIILSERNIENDDLRPEQVIERLHGYFTPDRENYWGFTKQTKKDTTTIEITGSEYEKLKPVSRFMCIRYSTKS